MEEKPKDDSQDKNWIIYAAIVIIAIAGICVILAGSLYFLQRRGKSLPFAAEFQNLMEGEGVLDIPPPANPDLEISTLIPLELPTLPSFDLPTPEPIEPAAPTEEPTETPSNLTGRQYLDDSTFIDDFSSESLGWPVLDGERATIQYEDQAYSIQVLEPDQAETAIAPVPFDPSYIMFDVWGLPGDQDGTFRVLCQRQDEANTYFIEFDLQNQRVKFGKIVEDVFFPLTEPGGNLEYWIPVDAFSPSPEKVNTIAIECRLQVIILRINDEFIQTVPIPSPFNTPGKMAFSVYAWDSAGTGGYKIIFDNVLIR